MRRSRPSLAPLLLPLALACAWGAEGSSFGQTAGRNEPDSWVEVRQGALPLIFSVPHGGSAQPAGFISRRYGSLMMDAQTRPLAEEVARAVQDRFGSPAHFVICHLHRSKLDCNRDLPEAAQGDAQAESVWRQYHAACARAAKQVTDRHGGGLLLDLHGHRHDEPNVELGYLLRSSDLALSDQALATDAQALERASIRGLVRPGGSTLADLVRGPASLGTLLEMRGQRSLPSTVRPQPNPGAAYFSGAYIVSRHGSAGGGKVSAIQIECPWEGVRDTEENRRQFARRLADALHEFLAAHLDWSP